MNTNAIKAFARAARLKLLDGVESRLKYWGINDNATVVEEPEATYGGYIFRGKVFTSTTAMDKWKRLQSKIKDKQAVKDVIEEAAYTWFNRLMAMKILEKNGYIPLSIGYENNNKTPAIVQEAKKGNYKPVKSSDQQNLLEYLDENKEEKAFALLITDFCNKFPLLKEVFGRINDYTELLIPNNLLTNNGLIEMINTTEAITDEDYKQVELIGWLYQFYISDRKDEVFAGFKNNKKARPEDIPAATQIFTPKWIVKYMVENTVGKIWLDYNPSSMICKGMRYLVENEDVKNNEPIISGITELTLMDPACGSGHILVEGFDLLMKMYLEEGYTKKNAAISILENNLYGLEIDDRAAQLARFALLLKAASYYPEIINLPLSETNKEGCNIYAFPEPTTYITDELLTVIGQEGRPFLDEIKESLDLLQQGKNIGSALKLNLSEEVVKFIEEILRKDHSTLVWQGLKPFLEIIVALSNKYYAVAANPPYMGQKNMNATLKDYINTHYPNTKSDLMTVFMEVIPNLTWDKSRFALINLPSWLFLSSFEKLREDYIDNYQFDSLLHMGRGIFGIDFGSVAFSVQKRKNENAIGYYFRLHERNFQHIYYWDIEKLFLYSKGNEEYRYDFSQYRSEDGITEIPEKGTIKGLKLFYPNTPQTNFSKIPGNPIAYWLSDKSLQIFNWACLGKYALPQTGLQTSDNKRFVRNWYEVDFNNIYFDCEKIEDSIHSELKWYPYNKGGSRRWAGDHEFLVNWQNNGEEIREFNAYLNATRTSSIGIGSTEYFFQKGVTIKKVGAKGFSARFLKSGFIFDAGGSVFFSDNPELLVAFLNSKVASFILTVLNPTINFQVGDIKRIPFQKEFNSKRSLIELEENIYLSSINDWNSQETSWDFEKSPLLNENTLLKQAYQNWQENVTQDFFKLHANEEELNRIFIKIYGLQKELTPEVPLKDITILLDEIDRTILEKLEKTFRNKGKDAIQLPIKKDIVISQFLSYCIGLMLGRYRLDKPGLNIAHPKPTEEELSSYKYNNYKVEIDDDAIIPFMGSESAFPDDVVSRVKNLLIAIWGEELLTENLNFIRECLGMDMERWLTEKFWTFHMRMYKKRPIYWLFTSNINKPNSAAFKVLVYMHRLDKYTVQKIRNNYLHPHQGWIKREIKKLKEDEAGLSREDQKRLTKLQQFELECSDYDEVLKDLANRQIEIDLDDGVKVNIEKFEPAVAKI
jgi:type II restriction/modification system DNA methylase subunit YeeA